MQLAGDERIVGSHLLVAAGRKCPMWKASISKRRASPTASEGITVDDLLRSSNRHVYAAGDVAGGLQFTHVAGYQAVQHHPPRTVPSTAPKLRNDIIPWVTYTDPELAHVGLTEEAGAQPSWRPHQSAALPFAGNDRAEAGRDKTKGLVKVVARPTWQASSGPPSSGRTRASRLPCGRWPSRKV